MRPIQASCAHHHTLRLGPFNNCSDLLQGSLNPFGADFKTKVVNLVLQKFTFVKSPIQFCFPELLQRPPEVLPVLVQVPTKHQDIVEVSCNEFPDVVSEDLIHQPLESCRCVVQSKRHDKKLKMASVSTKSYFLYRRLFHRNLVVSRCEVQLHKNLSLA